MVAMNSRRPESMSGPTSSGPVALAERTRCRACRSSCSSVLEGTKRVVERLGYGMGISEIILVPLPKRLRIRGGCDEVRF